MSQKTQQQCEDQNDVNPKHSQFSGKKLLGDFTVSAHYVCHEFLAILSKPRSVEQACLVESTFKVSFASRDESIIIIASFGPHSVLALLTASTHLFPLMAI